MARAAERIIPLTLELGGKSPNIVFADADLEAAAASAYAGFTFKSGQVCSAGTRLLVHADVHDRLIDLLTERAPLYQRFEQIGTGSRSPSDIADELAARLTAKVDGDLGVPAPRGEAPPPTA